MKSFKNNDMSLQQQKLWIGGPGTILPPFLESFLGWSMALSCLTVSGYYYFLDCYFKPICQRMLYLQLKSPIRRKNDNENQIRILFAQRYMPLMSYSRNELQRHTAYERYGQFQKVLNRILLNESVLANTSQHSTVAMIKNVWKQSEINVVPSNYSNNLSLPDDFTMIELIRKNEILRRLASLAMRPDPSSSSSSSSSSTNNIVYTTQFGQQLIRIWPQLLILPSLPYLQLSTFVISLIVPCYQERASDVLSKLYQALQNAMQPHHVQVILVLSGTKAQQQQFQNEVYHDKTLSQCMDVHQQGWGQMLCVEFCDNTGRGPCLNYGATYADGAIYAFCHSDTGLPKQWDQQLIQTFYPTTVMEKDTATNRSNSCAFGFGIDKTNGPIPPGIRAVEYTANLRCKWWSLPYGDQCLCLPATVYDYLGGFPHQCFMEDYDLIALLRKRSTLLPQLLQECEMTQHYPREHLTIIDGEPAQCSPRRWQKLGVFNVTFLNSKFVKVYAHGECTPEDIYQLYYGRMVGATTTISPWETHMESVLAS